MNSFVFGKYFYLPVLFREHCGNLRDSFAKSIIFANILFVKFEVVPEIK